MTRLGRLLAIFTIIVVFGAGFGVSYLTRPKPPFPEVGPINIVGSYDDILGSLYCFDEDSFVNLGNLLVAMSEEFREDE